MARGRKYPKHPNQLPAVQLHPVERALLNEVKEQAAMLNIVDGVTKDMQAGINLANFSKKLQFGWKAPGKSGTEIIIMSACSFAEETGVPLNPWVCATDEKVCARRECDRTESNIGKKKMLRCSKCYTPYCSRTCQTLEWNTHKIRCQSEEAFTSRVNHWAYHQGYDRENWNMDIDETIKYIDKFVRWLATDEIKELLEYTKVEGSKAIANEILQTHVNNIESRTLVENIVHNCIGKLLTK